jgi:hypothetical protein
LDHAALLERCASGRGARTGQGKKAFFFEKKNQKTFDYKVFAVPDRAPRALKVFWLAPFFKKNGFLLLAPNHTGCMAPACR